MQQIPPFAFSRRWGGMQVIRDFVGHPHDFLLEWARRTQEISLIQMGPYKAALVKDPRWVRELLVRQHNRVRKLPRHMKVLEQLDGKGVITAEAQAWERQRKLIMTVLRKDFLDLYAQGILKVLQEWSSAGPLRPNHDLLRITIRVIGSLMFGMDMRAKEDKLAAAAKDVAKAFTGEFANLLPRPRWWPGKVNHRKWQAIGELRAMAEEAVSSGKAPFLERLQAAAGEGLLSPEVLRDEIITLFMAGHDTTASALSWCLYRLGTERDWRERLRAEVAGADLGGSHVLEDFPQLTAFVYEVLRMHPPAIAMFQRVSDEALTAGDFMIPAGTLMYFSPLATGRDARHFAEPDAFKPERYLQDGKFQRPGDAWFPFGQGPHVCVGLQLAMLEIKIVLAYLLNTLHAEPQLPFDGAPVVEFSLWPRGENLWRVRR